MRYVLPRPYPRPVRGHAHSAEDETDPRTCSAQESGEPDLALNHPELHSTNQPTLMNCNQQAPTARSSDHLTRVNCPSPENVLHIPVDAAPINLAEERLSNGSPDLELTLTGQRSHRSNALLSGTVEEISEVCSSSQFCPELGVIEGLTILFALGIMIRTALCPNRERGFDLTSWILNLLLFMWVVASIFRFVWNLEPNYRDNYSTFDEL